MNKYPPAFIVISRFQEDVSWIHSVTDRYHYLIYNKGDKLHAPYRYNECVLPNFGGNQYDIFKFIYENYDNLPSVMAFVQGNPFDHCPRERFDRLITNRHFTPLFGDKNYPNGVYYEPNNNWYFNAPHNATKPPLTKFGSFDQYMSMIFEDYAPLPILFFPPGSQMIVERARAQFYSRSFWGKLMTLVSHEIGANGGREAHAIERSMQIIFQNTYRERPAPPYTYHESTSYNH